MHAQPTGSWRTASTPAWQWKTTLALVTLTAALGACSGDNDVDDAGTDSAMDAAADGGGSVCARAQTVLEGCSLDFPGSISDPAVISACADPFLLLFSNCVVMFPVDACSDEVVNDFTDCVLNP